MKKVIFSSILIMISYLTFAQDAKDVSVEKSIFGIQVGVVGAWIHNELKLTDQIALRSEIGISIEGLWTEDNGNGVGSGTSLPVLSLEPRWYYNVHRRASKGKRIDGNSANYLSLRGSYYNYDGSEAKRDRLNHPVLAAIWGIRRNIGKHFNYETGIGPALGFGNDNGRKIGLTPYVSFKIGYRF
ncbi:hypothetical protein [Aquimarina litoralis]|uniref:hypothetical protein n=1 Tax=Aquimarina litoralis TaxID=584605 RepID=UPI001C58CF7D|nr:hypothetical protein [Aquimarina litoralis]MBW1295686.1 hypothetical protein [Aquimarina litoralis]